MSWLIIFVYALFAVLTFGKLPLTFFQQDEWAIFGNYIFWDKANLQWLQRLFIYEQTTHLIPLANLVSYLQFKLYGLNFFLYGVSAIVIHLINSYLVFYLAYLLVKKKILAFLAGFLFFVNSISHQGFTWIATTIGTAGSIFFILVALIFFTKYLSGDKNSSRYVILSMIALIISIFFKETSLFGLIFFPIFALLYGKEKRFSVWKKALPMIFISGFFYVLLRFYFFFISGINASVSSELSQPGFSVYLYRLFSSPIKFLAQSIVPQEYTLTIAKNLTQLAYPIHPGFMEGRTPNPYIVESIASDVVSLFLSVLILFICFLFILYFHRVKQHLFANVIILALSFIVLSSFPFIFIPGKAGYFSLVDGRHLYLTETFTSILLIVLGWGVYSSFSKKFAVGFILVIIFLGLSFFHIKKIRNDMYIQIARAQIRKSILDRISASYPRLQKNAVFYVDSDTPFYGFAPGDNILPFQSGFGQTLLVWYNAKGENFPACLFENQFLYVQESQGYKECQGRGFGYFRKMNDLKDAINKNNLDTQNIIGFSYISSTNTLVDITDKVRNQNLK